MKFNLSRALASAYFAICLLAPVVRAIDTFWIGEPAGTWSDSSNWSTGVVPNTGTTNVTIDSNLLQESVVLLDQSATIQNLVVDAGDTLNIDPSWSLTANSVTLAGAINLATASRLNASDFFWIQQGATLISSPTASFRSTSTDTVLWNQGRIEGASANGPGFAFANDGVVTGNVAGESLILNFTPVISSRTNYNTGSFLAEKGGTLSLNTIRGVEGAILENSTGLIEARGNSTVFVGIGVRGGLLKTSHEADESEGTIRLSAATLENVRLEGNVRFDQVTLKGLIENYSQATSEPPQSAARLSVAGSATLAGDGTIRLSGGTISGASSFFGQLHKLTNGPDHAILGHGTINGFTTPNTLVLDNQGLIEVGDQMLQMTLHGTEVWSNSGTIRAKDGGSILFTNSASTPLAILDNTGGVIEAGVGSIVRLGAMSVRGGILRSVAPEEGSEQAAGQFQPNGGAQTYLEGLRLEGVIGQTGARWRLGGTIENTSKLLGDQINVEKDAVLNGGGVLELNGQLAGPLAGSSVDRTLTNEDNVITGNGTISTDRLALINRGMVQADGADKTLHIVGDFSTPRNLVVNSGTMRAINGGRLMLTAEVNNYEGSTQGTIFAGEGSLVQVAGVTGGSLLTEGTGQINANGVLTDVHLQGMINVQNTVGLAGRIQNDGIVASTSAGFGTYFVGPVVELTGNGTWGSSTVSHSISIGGNYRAIMIHGEDHTIRGSGHILINNGTLVNRGTIIAEGAAVPFRLTLSPGATISQEGLILVPAEKTLSIEMQDDRFNNKGTLDVGGEVFLRRLSQGPAELVNATGGSINLRGAIRVDSGSGIPNPVGLLWNQAGATLAGTGDLDLVKSISGSQGSLRNSGLIRPEGEFAELGRIYLDGDFEQDATGMLEMSIAGSEPGEFDALLLNGQNASLAGSLSIQPLATFDPPVGQQYTILDTQGGTVSGAFEQVSVPALPGRWWSLDYQADKVVLSVEAITADFNLDGVVDSQDLGLWQAAYGTDASGDADADGDSDGRDFLMWQQQYGSGVAATAEIAVPEPNSLAILVLASGMALARRRQFC